MPRPGHDQAAVLRAAIDLFNRQGYDATSMGDLARELGIGKSSLYHHVSGKEDLLSAALDEALDELTAAVTSACHGDGSAYERLRWLVRRSVDVLVAHQPAVTLLLRVRGNSPVEQAALLRRRGLDAQVAALVQQAVREDALRADTDPEVAARLMFGTVNSLVEWYDASGPLDPQTLADAVDRLVFEGLRRRSPR